MGSEGVLLGGRSWREDFTLQVGLERREAISEGLRRVLGFVERRRGIWRGR